MMYQLLLKASGNSLLTGGAGHRGGGASEAGGGESGRNPAIPRGRGTLGGLQKQKRKVAKNIKKHV